MGFKSNESFLHYLTMGATGAQSTIAQLRDEGFEPIELERYCTANKIWATKIKRFRLPDLLCVKTGLRIEVKTKSTLKIIMSDSPGNSDRAWDVGLRAEDLLAFIACTETNGKFEASGPANFFEVKSLQETVKHSRIGKQKSVSEGAERDRTWRSRTSTRSGLVKTFTRDKKSWAIKVEMDADDRPLRKHTFNYRRIRKGIPENSYVVEGDRFYAGSTIISGLPSAKFSLSKYLKQPYDVIGGLQSNDPIDRYSAVKALGHRTDLYKAGLPFLTKMIAKETEPRIALEAAGSAMKLKSNLGIHYIRKILRGTGLDDMKMEAIFILTEIKTSDSRLLLKEILADKTVSSELRQAAVWGLGSAGHQCCSEVIEFMDDSDENVALHAIAAMGSVVKQKVIDKLVEMLNQRCHRRASAASEVLRMADIQAVVKTLVAALHSSTPENYDWLMATLGRLDKTSIKKIVLCGTLLSKLEPLLLLHGSNNWLASTVRSGSILNLRQQLPA